MFWRQQPIFIANARDSQDDVMIPELESPQPDGLQQYGELDGKASPTKTARPTDAALVFQIADSDNDESLEELALQQEQEYWHRHDLYSSVSSDRPPSSPASSIAPLVTSKRTSECTTSSALPSPRSSSSAQSVLSKPHRNHAAQAVLQLPSSPTATHVDNVYMEMSISPSPDPLQLVTHVQEKQEPTRTPPAVDEGYHTKTDSDHVTGATSVSAPSLSRSSSPLPELPLVRQRHLLVRRTASPAPPIVPSSPTLPAQLHAAEAMEIAALISPGPASRPHAARRDSSSSASMETEAAVEALPKLASPPRPHGPEACRIIEEGVAGRTFRKRKAIQLAPYSAEFTKFASIAQKNDWQGVISAGLREAFVEKERARKQAEQQGRTRDPSDEWLIKDQEEESEYSEPELERRVPKSRPDSHSTSQSEDDAKTAERFSRKRTEKAWDPVASRLKAATKVSGSSASSAKKAPSVPKASTSRTTIEDLERERDKIKRRKEKARAELLHPKSGPSRSEQAAEAKRAGLLPSDVDSSSSESHTKKRVERPAKKKSRHSKTASTRDPAKEARRTEQQTVIDVADSGSEASTSGNDGPDDDGESSDRPVADMREHFMLTGKRRRAAMMMMPAVAFKKAEADLRLMEKEIDDGKRLPSEEREADNTPDAIRSQAAAAQAKTRWAPANADRPFRFVTELSSDDSGNDSDGVQSVDHGGDEETQAAMAAWTSLAAGKSKSPLSEDRSGHPGYWNDVIDRILVRNPQAGQRIKSSRKRKDVTRRSSKPPDKRSHKKRSVQASIKQHFREPVYLDKSETLQAATRFARPVSRILRKNKAKRKEFWVTLGHRPHEDDNVPSHNDHVAAPEPGGRPFLDLTQGDAVQDKPEASQFARFSYDFNIGRLPSGLSFVRGSYIGKGYLYDLVGHMESAERELSYQAVSPFGIALDSNITWEVMEGMLQRLADCVIAFALNPDSPSANLNCPIGQALHFITHYALDLVGSTAFGEAARHGLLTSLLGMEARLDKHIEESDELDTSFTTSLVSFRWHSIELAIRLYPALDSVSATIQETAKRNLLDALDDLVRLLLSQGIVPLEKAWRRLDINERGDAAGLDDIFCEAWVCFMHLCQTGEHSERFGFLTWSTFWQIIGHQIDEIAIEQSMHPILRGESASYTAVVLCALSQFSVHGVALRQPHAKPAWSILHSVVENIQTAELAQSYAKMATANRTRFSRYIWTIFARCLNMATRWQWSLLDQSKLIGKLFDILNARQLEDLCIDGEADFPAFLNDFRGHISPEIQQDDTACHIFLRIMALLGSECAESGDSRVKSIIGRVAMRVMPMREKLPYPRQRSSTSKGTDRSVLVNHCALFIALAGIDPPTADRRFAKLKTILDFENSDVRARQDYLKAMMFLGMIYKTKGIAIAPVLDWLTHTADYLCHGYTQCVKRRAASQLAKRKQGVASVARKDYGKHSKPQPASIVADGNIELQLLDIAKEMGEFAVMQGLLLGAVQRIMKTDITSSDAPRTYPPLEYLNPAWMANVLSSPMGRDPLAGSQLLLCLRTFFELRNAVMRTDSASAQSESQDDFGDMDFDYDDPALNAMLGLPEEKTAAISPDNSSALDQAFVEMLKRSISPLLYAILSDLNLVNVSSGSGVPDFPNKKEYVDGVVEAWAASAAILTQTKQRDWSYYTSAFGKEAWQRLGNEVGRYEVGVLFSKWMITYDAGAYQPHRDTLLEVFFKRIATPVLTRDDAELLTALLNADPQLLFWQGLPFQMDEILDAFHISLSTLEQDRRAVVQTIFSNCKRVLAKTMINLNGVQSSCAAVSREQKVSDQLVHQLLGHLLSSMRDFLDLSAPTTQQVTQAGYAAFCRQTLLALREELGPIYATEAALPQLRLLAGVTKGNPTR